MKRATPNQVKQVVAMRAAGWPLSAIKVEVGLSISTIQRICRRHNTKPGELQDKLVAASKKKLVESITNDERLQEHFSEMLLDSIAQSKLGREKALEAMEVLNPTNLNEAALTMRALSAHATATKTYADMLRQLMPSIEVAEELPEFVVKVMNDEDIARIRAEQEREFGLIDGTYDDDNTIIKES